MCVKVIWMTLSVRRTVWTVALCAAALSVAMSASAAITAKAVEKQMRTRLLEKWTCKNLKLKVTPYSSSARTRKGQFAEIRISADWAVRKGKHIKLVDVFVQAKDVQIDTKQMATKGKVVIKSRKYSKARVKLMETDVNRLLAMKKSSIQNLKCDFGNGLITFTGKYKLNIKLTGKLEIKNGYELHFIPTKASIGILGVPLGIVNRFLSNLNPIIDMREVPLKPRLKTLTIKPTYMTITG